MRGEKLMMTDGGKWGNIANLTWDIVPSET
jgi:hypothetical protein